MRVALDLDGVVYDWQGAYRYLANRHLAANLGPPEDWWTTWDAPDEYLSDLERKWMWTEGINLGLFRYGHILKGAVDGIREVAQIGDVYVVTSRPRSALRDTLRFVEGLPDVLAGVHILSNGEPKSSIPCDLYIDDALHVIEEVIAAGRKAILFQQPWNREGRTEAMLQAMHDERMVVAKNGWAGIPSLVRYLGGK